MPCFTFWGPHCSLEESNAKDLAYYTIAFQEAYQFDFIKIMESGMYIPEAFGQVIPPNVTPSMQSWQSVEKWRINHGKEWLQLRPLKVEDSPVFIREMEAGATGLFFGMQNGLNLKLGYEGYRKYEWASSARILDAIKDKCKFRMVHLCNGDGEAIDWALDLPCDAFNWADQQDNMPSLGEVRAKTDKVLVGGIKHNGGESLDRTTAYLHAPNDFSGACRADVKAVMKKRVEDAIEQAGNKLVICGGCGVDMDARRRFPVFQEVMDEIAEERAAGRK